eukprot:scaffold43311_cov34-Phaeocystis_antarctica.AAC.1
MALLTMAAPAMAPATPTRQPRPAKPRQARLRPRRQATGHVAQRRPAACGDRTACRAALPLGTTQLPPLTTTLTLTPDPDP